MQKTVNVADYNIDKAYVFANANVMKQDGKIIYMPIYMAMFLKNTQIDDYHYKVDLSGIV